MERMKSMKQPARCGPENSASVAGKEARGKVVTTSERHGPLEGDCMFEKLLKDSKRMT